MPFVYQDFSGNLWTQFSNYQIRQNLALWTPAPGNLECQETQGKHRLKCQEIDIGWSSQQNKSLSASL